MEELPVQHIITKDGSSTLYSPRFNEHYHSVHGAIQESMHVFIQMGLAAVSPERQSINLLEMGFGTGLNAFLTLIHSESRHIHYTGVECYPVSMDLVQTLNYPAELDKPEYATLFQQMHESVWNESHLLRPGFELFKFQGPLQEFTSERQFDLIYYDAFAPNAQPELWEDEVWVKLYGSMNSGGIFVTYSAKSSVRRGLLAAGFLVEKLPGPPGKREMLRAVKTQGLPNR